MLIIIQYVLLSFQSGVIFSIFALTEYFSKYFILLEEGHCVVVNQRASA